MQLLYWNTPVYGRLLGTIQCLDGHVMLSEVPVEDGATVETMVREFGDSCASLPPLRSAVGEMLEANGWTPDATHAPHLFYTPGKAKAPAKKAEGEAKTEGKKASAKARA